MAPNMTGKSNRREGVEPVTGSSRGHDESAELPEPRRYSLRIRDKKEEKTREDLKEREDQQQEKINKKGTKRKGKAIEPQEGKAPFLPVLSPVSSPSVASKRKRLAVKEKAADGKQKQLKKRLKKEETTTTEIVPGHGSASERMGQDMEIDEITENGMEDNISCKETRIRPKHRSDEWREMRESVVFQYSRELISLQEERQSDDKGLQEARRERKALEDRLPVLEEKYLNLVNLLKKLKSIVGSNEKKFAESKVQETALREELKKKQEMGVELGSIDGQVLKVVSRVSLTMDGKNRGWDANEIKHLKERKAYLTQALQVLKKKDHSKLLTIIEVQVKEREATLKESQTKRKKGEKHKEGISEEVKSIKLKLNSLSRLSNELKDKATSRQTRITKMLEIVYKMED